MNGKVGAMCHPAAEHCTSILFATGTGIDDWASMIGKVGAECRPAAAHCTSICFANGSGMWGVVGWGWVGWAGRGWGGWGGVGWGGSRAGGNSNQQSLLFKAIGLNPLAFTVPTLWGSGGRMAWPEPVGVHSSNAMGVGRLARIPLLFIA